MTRYTKKIPEFVYFVGEGEWIQGPYVNKPRTSSKIRKFKLTEETDKSSLGTDKENH